MKKSDFLKKCIQEPGFDVLSILRQADIDSDKVQDIMQSVEFMRSLPVDEAMLLIDIMEDEIGIQDVEQDFEHEEVGVHQIMEMCIDDHEFDYASHPPFKDYSEEGMIKAHQGIKILRSMKKENARKLAAIAEKSCNSRADEMTIRLKDLIIKSIIDIKYDYMPELELIYANHPKNARDRVVFQIEDARKMPESYRTQLELMIKDELH